MSDLDLNQIVLTKDELYFLFLLLRADNYVHESAAPESVEPYKLIDLGLIEEHEISEHTYYLISDMGERFLLSHRQEIFRFRLSESRQWITTVVAVLALILSVISLAWQYSSSKQLSRVSHIVEQSTMAADFLSSRS